MTEQEMRDSEAPRPKSMDELEAYIDSLVAQEHDYGTCVYAMSLAATAAFNFVAGKLGVTGFQASCADLDIVRRTRGIEGPFILLKGEDMLYPQYDLRQKLNEAIEEWKPYAKEQAIKNLTKHGGNEDQVHPNVLHHWKKLAAA